MSLFQKYYLKRAISHGIIDFFANPQSDYHKFDKYKTRMQLKLHFLFFSSIYFTLWITFHLVDKKSCKKLNLIHLVYSFNHFYRKNEQ